MNIPLSTYLRRFYEKNLFERIIIYLFIAELIVKIMFELILGQWYFEQSQNKQWIFYGLLALDYLVSFKKVTNVRISINAMSLFALFLFILIAHGLCVGILSRNPPFEIINDTIPLTMIALNILRFQSCEEMKKPIDFKCLLYFCTITAAAVCLIGQFAVSIGRPSVANVPVSPIFYPLFFTALVMIRPFPKPLLLMGIIALILVLPETNRTSLAFMALVMSVYAAFETIKNPSKGLLLIFGLITITSVSWMMLPEDSKTYNRIVGLAEIDFSKRTGSIGERQQEYDMIRRTISNKGGTYELVGLGFGGLYEAQFTHKYVKNYGHAHYSWAWFYLRFGTIGYFYMCIFMAALLFNAYRGFQVKHEVGRFTAFTCILGLLYCMTYVNAVFLSSGLHFLHLKPKKDGT